MDYDFVHLTLVTPPLTGSDLLGRETGIQPWEIPAPQEGVLQITWCPFPSDPRIPPPTPLSSSVAILERGHDVKSL